MGYLGIIKASGEEKSVNKFIKDIKSVLESAKEYDKETQDFFGCEHTRVFLVTEKEYDPFNVRMPSAMNPNVVIEYAYIKDDGSMAKEIWNAGRVDTLLFSNGSKQSLLRLLMLGYDQLADEENTED